MQTIREKYGLPASNQKLLDDSLFFRLYNLRIRVINPRLDFQKTKVTEQIIFGTNGKADGSSIYNLQLWSGPGSSVVRHNPV